ncbi:hypothetical protein GCM10018966_090880 [Streptomyces yanii]
MAGSSAAKTGAAPEAASAATRPAAAATRATRLAPDMELGDSEVISIPVCVKEKVRNSVPDDRSAFRKWQGFVEGWGGRVAAVAYFRQWG